MSYKPVSIPNLPSTTDPALRQFLSSIKEALEVRIRQRGNALDAAPTFRDLIDAGVIQLKDGVTIGGRSYTTDQLLGLVEFTLPSWITSDTAPPAPLGLTVTAANTVVTLLWTPSTFDQYEKTEIWRAASNDLSAAQRVGSTSGSTYVDSLPQADTAYFYWIRDIARNGLAGPFNDVNGASTIVGASAPTVTAAFSGPDVVFSWGTPTSNVTIQFYLVEAFIGAAWQAVDTVGGNLYRTRVTWLGARDFRIRAVDIQGNVGIAGAVTVTVVAPAAPAPTVGFSGENVVLRWSASSGGSLPAATYRVYENSVSPSNLLADQLSTVYQARVLWPSKTFYVSVVDTAGNEGPAAAVTATVQAPTGATIQAAVDGEYVKLTWSATQGSLAIAYYDVRFGASYAAGVPLATISGTTLSVRGDWTGDRTFWVAAVDTSENESTPSSVTVNLSAPAAPSPTHTFAGVTAVLEWSAVTGSLPVSYYEIRYGGASYATATFIERISGTAVAVPVDWLGDRTFWVAAVDILGNTGLAGSRVVSVLAPSSPAVSSTFSGPNCVLTWTASTSSLPVAEYEIRYGASFAAGVSVGRVKGTTFSQRVSWVGERTFWVAGVDQNDNIGAAGPASVAVSIAPAPALTVEVIDNNVLLRWNEVQGTLPTETYELRRGAAWASASVIGAKSGAFTTVFETAAGQYTYWIAAIDSAGNFGAHASVSATVAEPPDYLLAVNYATSYTGTKSNAVVDGNALVMPVSTIQTWTTHFTAKGWDQPQDQIDAGYPYYIQPGNLSGYYEESWDYGTTLAAMKITVDYLLTVLGGTVTDTVTITTALDAGFTTGVQTVTGRQAFVVNFRYVRVRLTMTATDDKGVARVENMTVKLDAKLKSDASTITLTSGGAHPQGNVAQDYYSLWVPDMSMPPAGFALNGGVAENKIISLAGPSGNLEPVWACVDVDVASDADGGWITSYTTADCTQGHLFAVFMRTTTNNGTSYWGTNQNSTILTLAGAVNSNPYFWSGDLPALNTWYLVVGYVHGIGYGTTDTAISGVYNLAGTRLVPGTEFKFAAGAQSLMHRAYHYYNATASSAEVQYMARPVVIQCAEADAPAQIQYILNCATTLGGIANFATDFVDITSITVSPAGPAVTIPIYDFEDVPYPKRFNIFNYTTAGVLTGGLVSWSVRGY